MVTVSPSGPPGLFKGVTTPPGLLGIFLFGFEPQRFRTTNPPSPGTSEQRGEKQMDGCSAALAA